MSNIFSMTDTWNAGATTFTAVQMNVTDTASTASSLLMDLQKGGVSQFSVGKAGTVTIPGPVSGVLQIGTYDDGGACFRVGNATATYFVFDVGFNGLFVGNAYHIGFSSNTNPNVAGADVRLYRDAAGVLAQRNGVNAQTARLYGTFTDASNGRWLSYAITSAGAATITPTGNGTGATGNTLNLVTGGTTVASLPAASAALQGGRMFVTDATAVTFLSAVVGGGTNKVPVVCDGTSWLIG